MAEIQLAVCVCYREYGHLLWDVSAGIDGHGALNRSRCRSQLRAEVHRWQQVQDSRRGAVTSLKISAMLYGLFSLHRLWYLSSLIMFFRCFVNKWIVFRGYEDYGIYYLKKGTGVETKVEMAASWHGCKVWLNGAVQMLSHQHRECCSCSPPPYCHGCTCTCTQGRTRRTLKLILMHDNIII